MYLSRTGLRDTRAKSAVLSAIFLCLLLVFILFAGCSETDSEKTEIVLYLRSVAPSQMQVFDKVARSFESEHPEIKVKILNIPYSAYWSKLFTMIAAGDPPDVVLMGNIFYPNFVEKGALMELSSFFENDPSISQDDFFPNTLRWLRVGDRIYGVPTDTAVIIPFYNKDLFEKAGVELPSEDWTWLDYLEISKQMTRDFDGDGNIDIWGTFLPPWMVAVWAWGGDWVDDTENPTRCTMDAPECVDAIRFLADMILVHEAASPETPQTVELDSFLMEKVAMSWHGHWQVPEYEQKAMFDWDVATLPKGPVKTAGFNLGSCLSITAQSKHPEKAWELISYFCGEKGASLLAKLNMVTPAHKEVARSPEFLERTPPEHHGRFIDAVQYAQDFPKTPACQELRDLIETQLEHVWVGEEDPQSVCERIARRGTQILQRAREASESDERGG